MLKCGRIPEGMQVRSPLKGHKVNLRGCDMINELCCTHSESFFRSFGLEIWLDNRFLVRGYKNIGNHWLNLYTMQISGLKLTCNYICQMNVVEEEVHFPLKVDIVMYFKVVPILEETRLVTFHHWTGHWNNSLFKTCYLWNWFLSALWFNVKNSLGPF